MKKMMCKFAALTMALVLMASLCLTAAAEEYALASPENLLKNNLVSECAADGADVSTVQSNDAAGTAKPVGIFALRLRSGSTAESMGAFLVQNGTSKYILTHAIAATYAADNVELTLMGMDGKNHTAICVGYQPEYELAYLWAEGMENYEPLKFSRDPFSKAVTVALSFSNNNYTAAKMIEYRSYDMGRFTQLSDLYYGEMDRDVSLQWLGSPILPGKGTTEVQGICSAIANEHGEMFLAVITFEELKLDSGFILGAVPPQQSEEQPVAPQPEPEPAPEPTPEPAPKTLDKRLVIAGVLIAAAIAYYFYNNKKKAQEKQQEVSQNVDVTVPAEPMVTHDVTRPMADWTLHCSGGPLNGKSFPVSGTVLLGRSSQAGISFPDNTPGISGRHCELSVSGDHIVLKDLNSSYGTFVNGKRLNPNVDQPLYSGDTFTLAQGGPTFRLEKAGGQQAFSLAVRSVDGKVYRADASGRLTFGRGSANSVRLEDSESAVSGAHCVLYYEGGKLYLKDLESTNGTFFSERERLKPNQAYRVNRGTSFFLVRPGNTFTIIEG